MTATVLSASPSWYCSRVIDSNAEGITCFGAKNSVYVWDICREPPVCVNHFSAHQERVVGVSLCKHPGGALTRAATAGEDGRVRVWDVAKGSMLMEHEVHAQVKKL